MLQTKVVNKIITHFMFSNFFFYHAIYEIIWKNILEPGRPQTIWSMCVASLIPTATNMHSEYAILIAFPLLHEHISILHYTYITCLVPLYFCIVNWKTNNSGSHSSRHSQNSNSYIRHYCNYIIITLYTKQQDTTNI
jgi:hypothetical protein